MLVLLRCDGGGRLGVGHVMRSLALAEAAVAAGHRVVVAGQFEGAFLQAQLAAAPVEVAPLVAAAAEGDLQQVVDLVRRRRPDVFHVDSYLGSDRLRELVAARGVEAGVIDQTPGDVTPGDVMSGNAISSTLIFSNMEDGTFGRRPADVVIDPTLGAEHTTRPQDGSTWLLRGSRYTPVRRRVIDARRRAAVDNVSGVGVAADIEVGQVARSVLVVMGGTDPVGLAPAAVALLARTGLALEVTAIAVGENAQRARAAAEGSVLSLNVLAPVDDLAAMMSGHDLVISAAGTSIWELCCIGVPAAVAWVVDNQREGYDRVVAAGAAVGLGGPDLGGDDRAVDLLRVALTDSLVRADLVVAGRRIVDGLGAWRVVQMWEQAGRQSVRQNRTPPSPPVTSAAALVTRPATLRDAEALWQWRNDPTTRASSRSPEQVSWDDHLQWLTASLARTDRVLLVIEDPGDPGDPADPGDTGGTDGAAGSVKTVGTVRWDLTAQEGEAEGSQEWEVSITVAPQWRGQSLGGLLLRAAEQALSEVTGSRGADVTAYLAVVHVDNPASVRLFETSAYVPDLPPDPRGFMRFRKVARVP